MSELNNKYIEVSYKLYGVRNGGERELIEEAPESQPFKFISELGMTLDDFEGQIAPLAEGAEYSFTLTPAQAYGPYVQEAVQVMPLKAFEINGKVDGKYIYEGAVIPLQNAEGERFQGTITRMTDTEVTVDLNHPLAGYDLTFEGKVLVSRLASTEELQAAIKMLSGGCGGGCGSCGGNCDGGDCGNGGCGGCGGCK